MTVELHFSKKDFKVEWFNNGSKGGQHANKHANCCRITHKESGLRCQSTKHKERPPNQKGAFTNLARLLIAYYNAAPEVRRRFDEARVRTYHEPRNEVLDHASGLKMRYTEVVGKPNIGPMIEARKQEQENE